MQAILLLLARPLIEAAVSAFGQVLIDLFASWRTREDAVARGRAEAERAAIIAAEAARDRMDLVPPLTDEEILRRLRGGMA